MKKVHYREPWLILSIMKTILGSHPIHCHNCHPSQVSNTLSQVPGPWKEINNPAREESPIKDAFLQNLSLKLGDRPTVRFWETPWVQTIPKALSWII